MSCSLETWSKSRSPDSEARRGAELRRRAAFQQAPAEVDPGLLVGPIGGVSILVKHLGMTVAGLAATRGGSSVCRLRDQTPRSRRSTTFGARDAVARAVDLEALNVATNQGLGQAMTTFFHDGDPLYSDEPLQEHDPEGAQALFDELAEEGEPLEFYHRRIRLCSRRGDTDPAEQLRERQGRGPSD